MMSFRKLLEYIVLLSLLEPTVKAAVSCPSGDTGGVVKDGQTCSVLITADNSECYNTTTETACCASCNTASTGNPASCLYGDSATCHSILCASYTGTALQNCCGTCGAVSTTTTTTTDAPTTAAPTTAAPITAAPTTAAPTTAAPTTASPTTSGGGGGASASSSSSRNNAGVIAGAVIGSLTCVCLLAVGTIILVRWFNKKNKVDGDSVESLPEKVDSHHKPADIERELPAKPYNSSPVFIAAQTAAPSDTATTHHQTINNNTSKNGATAKSKQTNNNTHQTDITEQSEQTNNNTNEDIEHINKVDDTLKEVIKTVSDDSTTESHTEIRRQSLPPLQGAKPTTNAEPLPPIAYKK